MKFLKLRKNKENLTKKRKKSFFQSFIWAASGIKNCFKRELNFRFHTFAAVLVIALSLFLRLKKNELILVLLCIMSVFVCELINTLAEEICNLISEDYNEKIKYIKDLAAGMVLISAVFSAVIGLLIFIPHIIDFFGLF